eukprot:6457679-Prorocentrum_lima.AAC.1
MATYTKGVIPMMPTRVIITALHVIGEHPQHRAYNMSLYQPTGPLWNASHEVVLKSLIQERGGELYKLMADQREVMRDRCGIIVPE